jgi:hypothetical protein
VYLTDPSVKVSPDDQEKNVMASIKLVQKYE